MQTKLKQKIELFRSSSLHEVVPFRVAAYAVGPDGRLTVPYLVRMLQEAAMVNTVRLKVSSPELIEHFGLSWILRRQRIECFTLPRMGQEVQVITAPSGFARRLQTFRDFHLLDARTGAHLATATSQWLLMDVASRRLRPIPDYIAALSDDLAPAAAQLERPEGKVAPPAHPHRTWTNHVGYHDLDFNGHLTNPVFPLYMLEPLRPDFLTTHTPRLLDIDYRAEAHYGNRITGLAEEGEEGWRHSLTRGEALLATMYSEWDPNEKPALRS